MYPEPTELLLIGCLIESIWTPRSKSNTLTPKTNSQTYWPREISHVTNWIIFCVCWTVAISVLPIVLKWCRKERKKMHVKKVTAKSKPMMNLVSRCSERTPDVVASTASESPGNPDLKVKYLWARGMSSNQERWDLLRTLTRQPNSEWNVDKTWSSQEWKTDE